MAEMKHSSCQKSKNARSSQKKDSKFWKDNSNAPTVYGEPVHEKLIPKSECLQMIKDADIVLHEVASCANELPTIRENGVCNLSEAGSFLFDELQSETELHGKCETLSWGMKDISPLLVSDVYQISDGLQWGNAIDEQLMADQPGNSDLNGPVTAKQCMQLESMNCDDQCEKDVTVILSETEKEKEFKTLNERCSAYWDQIIELKSINKQLEKRIQDMSNDRFVQESQKEFTETHLSTQVEVMAADKINLQAEVDRLKLENEKKVSSIRKLEVSKKEFKQVIATLHEKISMLQAENRSFSVSLREAKRENLALSERIELLKKEAETVFSSKESLSLRLQHTESHARTLQEHAEELQSTNTELETIVEDLKTHIESLFEQKSFTENEVQRLDKELKRVTTSVSESDEIKKDYVHVLATNEELERQVGELKQCHAECANKIRQLGERNASLHHQIEMLNNVKEELGDKLHSVCQQLDIVGKEIDTKSSEKDQVNADYISTREQLMSANRQITGLLQQMNNVYKSNSKLFEELSTARCDLLEHRDLAEQINMLHLEIQGKSEQIQNLRERVGKIAEEKKQVQIILSETRKRVAHLSSKEILCSDLKRKIMDYKNENRKFLNENQDLRSRLASLESPAPVSNTELPSETFLLVDSGANIREGHILRGRIHRHVRAQCLSLRNLISLIFFGQRRSRTQNLLRWSLFGNVCGILVALYIFVFCPS